MKKTLCKTLHEANEECFVQLEDIQRIYIENEDTVVAACKNSLNQFFKIKCRSGLNAETLQNNIIKELEVYYETQKV